MKVVVDASLLVDALLGVDGVIERLAGHELHAPVSVDAEALHGIRRDWVRHFIDDDEALAVIRALRALPIQRHPVTPFLERMWSLRRNVAAYDAGYVALAESLNVPLLTRDRRLSNASGHTARIEYID